MYPHKSYISNNLKGAISEYKGVFHCEGYDYEEFPDENMEALLSERFFTRRMKMLSRPDGFMLYGKMSVDFFSTSELLNPKTKVRLRLIRARPNFYMISDDPHVSLGIVDFHFTLIVLLSRMNITRNETTCSLTHLWNSTIWILLQSLSSFLPNKTSSFKKVFSTSWRGPVVPRLWNKSYYLTRWKLNQVSISFRSKLPCWFDTDAIGFETDVCRGLWLRNLQYQRSRKKHKDGAKTEKEATAEEDEQFTFPLVTQINKILHSISSNIELFFNNQQKYYSNGLYAHKFYISNNFKGTITEYEDILHCKWYDYEEFPDQIMESSLSQSIFARRMKMLSRRDGFMFYGNLGVDFFSSSDLLSPNMKISLPLVRARPNFDMVSDIPNDSFRTVDCSLYTRRFALKDNHHKKRVNMLAYIPVKFEYLETLAKTFIIPVDKTSASKKKHFKQCSGSSNCYCNEYSRDSLDHLLKIFSGINNWSSDKLEYSEEVNLR